MMTPQEKAKELVLYMFTVSIHTTLEDAKKLSTITVDEIIKECDRLSNKFDLGLEGTKEYWFKVATEIENCEI